MKFVRIVHEDPDIAPAVVSERAAGAYAQRGWQLEELVTNPSPVDEPKRELKRPQKNDSTAAWRTYAVALGPENGGLSLTEAFDVSRDALVERYAPADPKPPAAPKAPRKRVRPRVSAPQPTPDLEPPTETSTAPAKTDTKEN